MFQEIVTYGIPVLTFGAGYFLAHWNAEPELRECYPQRDWEKEVDKNWKRFVDACRECNTIEEELQDALTENRRLQSHIDNMRALFAELVEQGRKSTSGTARKMATKAKAGLAK